MSEEVHDVRKEAPFEPGKFAREFKQLAHLEKAFVDRLVSKARGYLEAFKSTESEAVNAIDMRREDYIDVFRAFYGKDGDTNSITIDDIQAENAWQRVRKQAVERFYKAPHESLEVGAPPVKKEDKNTMPPPPPPPQETERKTTAQEKPLAIMDAGKWLEWYEQVFSKEVYERFAGVFGTELAIALGELSTDMQMRTVQVEQMKALFQQKLFRMYCNQYPERHAEELRENVQGWLDERWDELKKAAERLPIAQGHQS